MNQNTQQAPYPQDSIPGAGNNSTYQPTYSPNEGVYDPQHAPPAQHASAAQHVPIHSSHAYPPHLYPPTYPPPEQPSIFKSIMKVIGWALLLTVLFGGTVLATGWWTLNRGVQDAFSLESQSTLVTAAPVIESLKRVNKQIFVEHYNMVDIDYSEAPEGWLGVLPIEQSFVVLLKGRVAAGFDMGQLQAEDVWVSEDGKKVQLTLPAPIIFEENVNVDFENSRILVQQDTCPNFICEETIETYKNQIFPQGRKLLIESSQQSGIMEQSAEMGILYYENFLRAFGFEEVRVGIRSTIQIEQE